MLSNEQTDFHQIFDIYPVLFVNGGTPWKFAPPQKKK